MGNFHPTPVEDRKNESYSTFEGLDVGASGMQGWRTEMEDAHVTINMPSKPDHTFLAVFDGHGGSSSAAFSAANMLNIIEKNVYWARYLESGALDVEMLGIALSQSYHETDDALRVSIAGDTRNMSGCTCVSVIITPRFIVCGNAGDSRCVIGTNKLTKAMSRDHKPNDDLEKRRIEFAGGKVQGGRVDGDLSVARAFGDFRFKNRFDLPAKQQKITCDPDITVHERSGADEMLLLACDGLWDVLSNEAAVAAMRSIFANGRGSAAAAAGDMLDIALRRGSKDNISAIIVRLPGAQTGHLSSLGRRAK